MPLDWNFLFVSSNHIENPQIEYVCSFRDGNFQFSANATDNAGSDIIKQLEPVVILINYIAYFPQKDFTKIKLHAGNNQFAIHFLDKRFLEQGFLGILSVSEFDQQAPFENWGVEELLAEFAFDNFMEMKNPTKIGEFDFSKYQKWLESEIKEFYKDWQEARREELTKKVDNESKYKALNYDKYEQWWDFQVFNEYGNPITDLVSFINDQSYVVDSTDEKIMQNLEGMSLSALKILIETQGAWNIMYLKNQLKNEMGYQYIFFSHFSVERIKYLIILNSALYEISSGKCIQAFRGFEFEMLNQIAVHLVQHPDFFNQQGQIRPENKSLTQRIIMKTIQQYIE